MATKFLHTMVRVRDIDESKRFYCDLLGLVETRRKDLDGAKATLVFLSEPGGGPGNEIELTYNWGSDEEYGSGRNFGHLAYAVDNISDGCRGHHQPPAARRPHGLREIARRHFDRTAPGRGLAAAAGTLGEHGKHRVMVTGSW
jgi:catechol 2,3-dioxygenase-like lactoylglutathione lyase family enzyme